MPSRLPWWTNQRFSLVDPRHDNGCWQKLFFIVQSLCALGRGFSPQHVKCPKRPIVNPSSEKGTRWKNHDRFVLLLFTKFVWWHSNSAVIYEMKPALKTEFTDGSISIWQAYGTNSENTTECQWPFDRAASGKDYSKLNQPGRAVACEVWASLWWLWRPHEAAPRVYGASPGRCSWCVVYYCPYHYDVCLGHWAARVLWRAGLRPRSLRCLILLLLHPLQHTCNVWFDARNRHFCTLAFWMIASLGWI